MFRHVATGKTRNKLLSGAATFILGAVAFAQGAHAAEELNALVWCDHTDPALLEPFEKQYDVKVNLKEYEGTGAGLSIIEQSRPGDWDVFVIDGVDVHRAVEMGVLAEIPADALPTSDIFPEVVMAENNTWCVDSPLTRVLGNVDLDPVSSGR